MFDVGDTRSKQGGAVMLMVAFSLLAFFAFAALAVDLGRLYIIKSQLQNAADAGALRGARELNGLDKGINAADKNARLSALTNKFMLVANPLVDADPEKGIEGDITVKFATTPFPANETEWVDKAAALSNPRNYFYIRVDTKAEGISSFFAGIIGELHALAVAGRTSCEMLPVFICGEVGIANWGFQVGRSYSFVPSPDPNEVGAGNVGYLHPTADGSAGCGGVHSIGTPELQRLICIGRTPCFSLPSTRCSVTQPARPQIADAFNTRFDEYTASLPNDLDFNTCPPDKNIKEFTPALAADWMEGNPTDQSLAEWHPDKKYKKGDKIMITRNKFSFPPTTPPSGDPINLSFIAAENGTSGATEPAWNPAVGAETSDGDVKWTTTNYQSVWWSYVDPSIAPLSWTPPDLVTAPPLRTDKPDEKQPPGLAKQNYPGFKNENLTDWVSPYNLSCNLGYCTPPTHQAADEAKQPRRLVSIGIATNCKKIKGTGSQVDIAAIGKFFLQIKADGTGPQDMLHGELAEIVTTIMETTYPEIRLYR